MRNLIYRLCCLALPILLAFPAFAQAQMKVSGTVTSKDKEPLIGVIVQLKDSNVGTITDNDGTYSITVPKTNSTLVFSYIGFEAQEQKVNDAKLDVVLSDKATNLKEVVVVGYGSMMKRDITGAISSVDSKSIEERSPVSIYEALQGQIAGVEISTGSGAPGETAEVRIRGTATFDEGGAGPLYVVDGVPVDNIDDINPNDIESIEVLKDAASAAIYGSRSANGVILITTKEGEATKPRLDIRYLNSYSNLTRKMPKANANERRFFDSVRRKYYNTENYAYSTGDNYSNFNNQDIDMQDLIFQTAARNQIDLVSGGASNAFKYYVSVGYLDEEGIIVNSDYNRLTSRINIEYLPSDKLTIGSKIQLSYSDKNGISEADVLTQLLQRIPYWAVFEPDGSYVPNVAGRTNPYAVAMNDTQKTKTFKASVYQYLKYKINDKITFNTNVQGVFSNWEYQYYRPKPQISLTANTTGRDQGIRKYNWVNENYISYDTKVNKDHQISAMLGTSAQYFHEKRTDLEGLNYTTDELYTLNAASDYNVKNTYTTESVHTMASIFGRLGYNYQSKYLFNANMRYDGSSRFGKSNRWGAFPSVSGGWRFSSEPFMGWAGKLLSDGKVRVSYGITGNETIGDYEALLLYAPDYIYNGVSGIGAYNLAYNDLSWEETSQFNIGLDLRLLKSKLNIVFDYYDKKTDKLLSRVQLPKETGFSSIRKNVGAMQNRGYELTVDYRIIRKKDWQWSVNFNIATNESKISEIADGIPFYRGKGDAIYVQEGRRIGEFYGYKQLGIFAYDESNAFSDKGERLNPVFQNGIFQGYTLNGENYSGVVSQKKNAAGDILKGGDVDFVDTNGDGLITSADKQLIGCAQPDFYGGISTNVSCRQFSLFVSLYYSFGGDLYRYEEANRNSFVGDATTPSPNAIHNMWTQPGDEALYPIPIPSDHNRMGPSDFYIEDGSYVKLRNVRLSYNLPKSLINNAWMKDASVYAYGNNLLTFTNYSGYDPEFAEGGDPLNLGIDTNRYPRKREIGFGININF